jgi:hypothetical protein
MRGWRNKNAAYTPRNIQPTVPYGGGSVMVWGVSLMTASWIQSEVPEHLYDGLTCPKYALWDSNPGSWLAKEER